MKTAKQRARVRELLLEVLEQRKTDFPQGSAGYKRASRVAARLWEAGEILLEQQLEEEKEETKDL